MRTFTSLSSKLLLGFLCLIPSVSCNEHWCLDNQESFEVDLQGVLLTKNCEWVKEQPADRCEYVQAENQCPLTCGKCAKGLLDSIKEIKPSLPSRSLARTQCYASEFMGQTIYTFVKAINQCVRIDIKDGGIIAADVGDNPTCTLENATNFLGVLSYYNSTGTVGPDLISYVPGQYAITLKIEEDVSVSGPTVFPMGDVNGVLQISLVVPSCAQTYSSMPSSAPSSTPSGVPTSKPSDLPSSMPSNYTSPQPTMLASNMPSETTHPAPSSEPSSYSTYCSLNEFFGQSFILQTIFFCWKMDLFEGGKIYNFPGCDSSLPQDNLEVISYYDYSKHRIAYFDTRGDSTMNYGQVWFVEDPTVTSNVPVVVTNGKSFDILIQVQHCTVPSSMPSSVPTLAPSLTPSMQPTEIPSTQPTVMPSLVPSSAPSSKPSAGPSLAPTSTPSTTPTSSPSQMPSSSPSASYDCAIKLFEDQTIVVGTGTFCLKIELFAGGMIYIVRGISVCSSDFDPSVAELVPLSEFHYTSELNKKAYYHPGNITNGWDAKLYFTEDLSVTTTTAETISIDMNSLYIELNIIVQHCAVPSSIPSSVPSLTPTLSPSLTPTLQPSVVPTASPSVIPSSIPSSYPSLMPSSSPTEMPSLTPSLTPSVKPSTMPSSVPTLIPSLTPSSSPSLTPSGNPTLIPSSTPSTVPTNIPSSAPSLLPSSVPSLTPTSIPTSVPSSTPSLEPSSEPSLIPSAMPSVTPTSTPSTQPSLMPSTEPSSMPTNSPSSQPSLSPSSAPSQYPSTTPSLSPSLKPSQYPSLQPSSQPSSMPSLQPSSMPSLKPSQYPSMKPSQYPSLEPSMKPSQYPSLEPSAKPSQYPSLIPSQHPSLEPSQYPSLIPSQHPSLEPSSTPSQYPSLIPSQHPSQEPSNRRAFKLKPETVDGAAPNTEYCLEADAAGGANTHIQVKVCDGTDKQLWNLRADDLLETYINYERTAPGNGSSMCMTFNGFSPGNDITLQVCDPSDTSQQLALIENANQRYEIKAVANSLYCIDHDDIDQDILVWTCDDSSDQFFFKEDSYVAD